MKNPQSMKSKKVRNKFNANANDSKKAKIALRNKRKNNNK